MNERQMWKKIVSLLAKYKITDVEVNTDILDIDFAQPDTEYPDLEKLTDYILWGPTGQSCIFITDANNILGICLVGPSGGKPDVILDYEQDQKRIRRFLKVGDFTKE